jgi:hypothetical protein
VPLAHSLAGRAERSPRQLQNASAGALVFVLWSRARTVSALRWTFLS